MRRATSRVLERLNCAMRLVVAIAVAQVKELILAFAIAVEKLSYNVRRYRRYNGVSSCNVQPVLELIGNGELEED